MLNWHLKDVQQMLSRWSDL